MQSLQPGQLQDFVAGETGAVLLDVREPWEIARARIRLPGATALDIPMNQLPARLAEIDRAQSVVCICHHGARSAQVVAYLLHLGYPRVYNLAGGVDAWSTLVDRAVPRY
jgi:rhodanese-related sulfurtransferase